MRQDESQKDLLELLQAIRNGTLDRKKHWPLLASRNYANLPEEEKKLFQKDCLKICATNKACKAYNVQKLKEMKVPVAVIDSVNEPASGKGLSTNKAGGLPNDTLLAEGGKVMLHSNLWTEGGLTNGSKGIISRILYKNNRKPPQVPDAVLCHFPDYKGPAFDFDSEGRKLIPIVAKSVEFFHYNIKHVRTTIPLSPCDAISCHKCQGQTCTSHTLMDLGGREFCLGLFYVALSRVKELNRMAFDPMPDWMRVSSFTKRAEFKERLNEEEKLDKLFKETLQRYRDSRKDNKNVDIQDAQEDQIDLEVLEGLEGLFSQDDNDNVLWNADEFD